MNPLPTTLQPKFEGTFSSLLRRVHATAKRRASGDVDEVDWIEKFQALVSVDIEAGLRRDLRSGGHRLSVAVNSALLHGSPFQAWPRWKHYSTARSIEIGDLLIIAEWHSEDLALLERQALLLQMKVGTPSLGGVVRGSKAQAELYATWPPFGWSKKLRATLPGAFPRTPDPQTTSATQFGVIPPRGDESWPKHDALPVGPGPTLGPALRLETALARAIRLDLGVDATPGGGDNGWPRVVQDMLDAAPRYRFRGQQRFVSALGSPRATEADAGVGGDVDGVKGRFLRPRGRRFLIVQVGFGSEGILD